MKYSIIFLICLLIQPNISTAQMILGTIDVNKITDKSTAYLKAAKTLKAKMKHLQNNAVDASKIMAIKFTDFRKFYTSDSYGPGFVDRFNHNKPRFFAWYIRKPSNAHVFSSAIGYGVSDNIRAELSYESFYGMKYKSVRAVALSDDGYVKTMQELSNKQRANAVFLSTFYDIKDNKLKKFTPYVGAGIGLSHNKSRNIDFVERARKRTVKVLNNNKMVETSNVVTANLAWHFSAGVNYVVNDKIDLLFNYKYANLGKANTIPNNGVFLTNKLRVHIVISGITFKF